MRLTHLSRDYKKVLKVIISCECQEHLDVANKLITYFYLKHGNGFLLEKLEKRFWFKKKNDRNKKSF